jgi:hypothetical protein
MPVDNVLFDFLRNQNEHFCCSAILNLKKYGQMKLAKDKHKGCKIIVWNVISRMPGNG